MKQTEEEEQAAHRDDNNKKIFIGPLPLCKCGCGETVKICKNSGLPNKFINHHAWRTIKHSDESKLKISKSRKRNYGGNNHPRFGKHCSEETKKKISESNMGKSTGEKNPMFGKCGEDAPGWKGGISALPYCYKFNRKTKNIVRNRDNYTCQNCGVIETSKKHSIHHIHYDKENCYPDLITLCGSCNSKANGNRDYWESYYMNKLNDRELLHWTLNNIK